MIILYTFITYAFVVFVLLRLAVPHMGFWKSPLPSILPVDLKSAVEEVSASSETKQEALTKSYNYVTKRYYGGRFKTVLLFWRAFGSPLVKSPGFLQCNAQNYILRTVLIKSCFFSENDIDIKVVPFNLFIHQYLVVNVDGEFVDVDPWSHFKGMRVGEKSSWFG